MAGNSKAHWATYPFDSEHRRNQSLLRSFNSTLVCNASILSIYMSFGYNKAIKHVVHILIHIGVLGLTLRMKAGFWRVLSFAINLFKLGLLHPNSRSLEDLKKKSEPLCFDSQ